MLMSTSMAEIQNLNINFAFNNLFLILGILVLIAYSYFVYRFTVPKVKPLFRYFLFGIRSLAIILILLAIFEPILTYQEVETIKPQNYFFVDNSSSIVFSDSASRQNQMDNFLNEVNNSFNNDYQIKAFGKRVDDVSSDSLNKINFKEQATNYNDIIRNLKENSENISAAVILSDGVITEGENPLYKAEKLGIPIFTIGVGDTTESKDLEVRKVLYNEYIYADKTTEIKATILNQNYVGENAEVILREGSNVVARKRTKLNETGINEVTFEYTPEQPGEKKLSISVSQFQGELTYENNRKVFFINVLDDKLNVLLIAGSPSPDLSFVKNSLQQDEKLKVNSIVQISGSKFLDENNFSDKIDSADILYLIGFPASNTPNNLVNSVHNAISNSRKPFFVSLAPAVDLNRLKKFQNQLPFTINSITSDETQVQPSIQDVTNPLIVNGISNPIESWNNLPPVYKNNSNLKPKPESNIIAKTSIRNVQTASPLLLSRKVSGYRSIAVLGREIWKWKLQSSRQNAELFDNFISNTVKWLNTREDQKKVRLRTTKRLYTSAETIEFIGEVYDETFTPLDNASFTVTVNNGNDESYSIEMLSEGNGIYRGNLETKQPGSYEYQGSAELENRTLGSDNGKFSIEDINVENLNPKMDKNFLKLLANRTGGNFYNLGDHSALFNQLKNRLEGQQYTKTNEYELALWSDQLLLIIIIILFGMEWFLRKRAGMI